MGIVILRMMLFLSKVFSIKYILGGIGRTYGERVATGLVMVVTQKATDPNSNTPAARERLTNQRDFGLRGGFCYC